MWDYFPLFQFNIFSDLMNMWQSTQEIHIRIKLHES